MKERRDPAHQQPRVTGHRATDPTLTTRDCCRRLGLKDTSYIVGEIKEGRLRATVIQTPGRRAIYRIAQTDFDTWCVTYLWTPLHADDVAS